MPGVDPRLEHLERLRQWRGRKERNVELGGMLREFVREQRRVAASLGVVTESFEAIVPGVIARECTLVGLRRGVLTVETQSSACRFVLDRFLRAGGEERLRVASEPTAQPIVRVKVVCKHEG